MQPVNAADLKCEPWPLAMHCMPSTWDRDPARWDESQKFAQWQASVDLRRMTANTYGLCNLKVRPCRKACAPWKAEWLNYSPMGVGYGGPWIPILSGGNPANVYRGACGCGGWDTQCGCSELCEVILDPWISSVIEVKVDGLVVPASAYRVDDNRKLVRTDGKCWPECQPMELPDTAMGTFSITYRTGIDPATDPSAMVAAADLTLRNWRQCQSADASCGPPSEYVTSIRRDGVEYDLDIQSAYENGRTGVPSVDRFLAQVNPGAARTQFKAWSPDIVRSRRTTWELRMCQEYVHTQTAPSDRWVITHTIGCCPSAVDIEDPSGAPLLGADVDCVTSKPNEVIVQFGSPYAGKATLRF